MIAGNIIHSLSREIWIRFCLSNNFCLSWSEGTLETTYNSHWDNNILIFITLISATQLICNTPNEIYLTCYVNGRIIIDITSIFYI